MRPLRGILPRSSTAVCADAPLDARIVAVLSIWNSLKFLYPTGSDWIPADFVIDEIVAPGGVSLDTSRETRRTRSKLSTAEGAGNGVRKVQSKVKTRVLAGGC